MPSIFLSKGEFIDCFKLATVCPVFKKGDSNNIDNYRPVSLLSNISKLLEKVMYDRLYSFLEKQNFFTIINLVLEKIILLHMQFQF